MDTVKENRKTRRKGADEIRKGRGGKQEARRTTGGEERRRAKSEGVKKITKRRETEGGKKTERSDRERTKN